MSLIHHGLRNCLKCFPTFHVHSLNMNVIQVGVYRMSEERIGCSLADAAASPAYIDYLAQAAASVSFPSLHVVYINTSLETKAYTHEVVPTITCTSSNVVQTVLQVRYTFYYCICYTTCLLQFCFNQFELLLLHLPGIFRNS